MTRAVLEAARGENPDGVPSVAWFKTRKGRGYGKYDNKSHGTPHAMNSPEFWAVRKEFMERHGVDVRRRRRAGADRRGRARGAGAPQLRRGDGRAARRHRAGRSRSATGWSRSPARCRTGSRASTSAATAPRSSTTRASPTSRPTRRRCGSSPARRRRTGPRWRPGAPGSTPTARPEYDRPLFIACSADLAESTNIAGFAKDFGEDCPAGAGTTATRTCAARCCRSRSPSSRTRASRVGIATVNLADDPMTAFNGFWAACSTYGSFIYLKYGPMRLFSQLAQDCELKVGKVIWVAGHSGPETAEDSPHALRHLRDRRHAALPGGPRHRPAPVGVQRGAGRARRGAGDRCARSWRCT